MPKFFLALILLQIFFVVPASANDKYLNTIGWFMRENGKVIPYHQAIDAAPSHISAAENIPAISTLTREGPSAWSRMVKSLARVSLEDSKVRPYFGVGLGAVGAGQKSSNANGASLVEDGDTALTYQGIAGAELPLSEKTSIGVEYKYLATDDPAYQGAVEKVEHNPSQSFLFRVKIGW